MLDRLLSRLLAGPVDAAVRRALEERERQQPQLYRDQVHGDPSRLTIHPPPIVNDGLFDLSSRRVSVGEYAVVAGRPEAVRTIGRP